MLLCMCSNVLIVFMDVCVAKCNQMFTVTPQFCSFQLWTKVLNKVNVRACVWWDLPPLFTWKAWFLMDGVMLVIFFYIFAIAYAIFLMQTNNTKYGVILQYVKGWLHLAFDGNHNADVACENEFDSSGLNGTTTQTRVSVTCFFSTGRNMKTFIAEWVFCKNWCCVMWEMKKIKMWLMSFFFK